MNCFVQFYFVALVVFKDLNVVQSAFRYQSTIQGLEIFLDNRLIISHTRVNPSIEIGKGTAEYENDLGNFYIHSSLLERIPLSLTEIIDDPSLSDDKEQTESHSFQVRFSSEDLTKQITLVFDSNNDDNTISINAASRKNFNRVWIRFYAEENEHIYGGGEQFSYFSLRGHAYPMWTREQGVGRNKSTVITYLADKIAGAGGDYHTTYWPQPTFVSDRLYFSHLDYYSYSVLNFSSSTNLEIEMWDDFEKAQFHFKTANSWKHLLTKMTSFFGRQPNLPSWVYNGAILGLQGGTDVVLSKYQQLKEQGVKVSAIWIQDWSGKFMTSLGKRVYWNWSWNSDFYPNLKEILKRFKEEENVRFLSYINPHVLQGSEMFNYADNKGFFIKSVSTGKTKLIEFGEMPCGSVDLTNPEAYTWYKGVIQEMAILGFSGWMADFGGEYLPIEDMLYHDKSMTSLEMHNAYSEIWAKLNREAIEEINLLEDTLIFMRSGFGKSPGYTTVSWGGDQNVDFSYADGLASVVPAALSLGMSGMGIHHSDIGGYVSLICMVRTEEMILRWGEMNIFTPIFRTHEGNRPHNNWQVYTSNYTAKAFARLSKIYRELAPYHAFVSEENAQLGYPAQRPLFFHYPDDTKSYEIQYQYLYGPDLLVAPVLFENKKTKLVYLPPDDWIYLWNGTEISIKPNTDGSGKIIGVESEVGNTPVFYRKKTTWSNLFETIRSYTLKKPLGMEGLSWELLWNEPRIFLYLLFRKMFWYIFFNV